MVFIASSGVLDGTTNVVTFSSIPSTFTHLQVRITSRSARVSANDSIWMRFNTDSGTNYSYHNLYGDGSNPYSQGSANSNVMFPFYTPAASATTGMFGSAVIDVLDYTNTNKNKTVRSLNGYDANGSGLVALQSSAWFSTAAITGLQFANYFTGANFVAGSRIDLYGITSSQVTGA